MVGDGLGRELGCWGGGLVGIEGFPVLEDEY